VTGAVTTFSETSATVTGTVNPNGQATTWYFDYGPSTSYGSKTAATSVGSGTTGTAVSATISGLVPGTTYHYRLVATNPSGTSDGADGTFTTSGSPVPAAVTGSATNLSATSATLDGSVNPNGRSTTWHFEFGTSTSYGTATATKGAGSGTSSTNVSAALAGLTPGTTYHYRLVATNASGTTAGADRTFTTVGAPVVATGPAQSVAMTSA